MVMGELTQETELLVIGGGPGGYAAAFRAADLGMDVTLVDSDPSPGGVCLFRGCIPSKTLLFLTELLHDAGRSAAMGIRFGHPEIDLVAIRSWKEQVVQRLAKGLMTLCRQRGVQVLQARAVFEDAQRVRLSAGDITHLKFHHAILATGSRPIPLPGENQGLGGRVMDSTAALALADIPKTLLVVGGGYVGLELGMVYASLGSRVTLVELGDRLLPGMDRDLVKPLEQRVAEMFDAVHLHTRVARLTTLAGHVEVDLAGDGGERGQRFERVLVAIGRQANSADLGLERTKVELDPRGFVRVDEQQRTADPHIYAVGDVVGGIMLAHKAMREGRVAAEAISGQPSAFDVRAIPAVVYTDPQVATCGLTEEQAQATQRPYRVSRFPWSASGRAMTMGAMEGLTKVIFDPESQRVLGVGLVGRGAGEMIAEGALAVEMGAVAEDLALTMHPHPTLSETEEEAAEAYLGSAIHLVTPKSS
ncbi:MAG TPA: dihydrolipoyl dehydrogenase [Syntrophobacteraceae bacterium]|nr:dihydrolipoyl dehydrogenase [Syntrophobacteraceae bacterium]